MALINFEINVILTWSANFFIVPGTVTNQVTTFATTGTEFYVPVVTLSTQYNTTLLRQLKSGFKGTINLNKYQPKTAIQTLNQYLDYLIVTSFQGVIELLFYHLKMICTEQVKSDILL